MRSIKGDDLGQNLTLPVPETLYGTYAVALAEPIPDPASLARAEVTRRTTPPLRDLVLGMLDSPMLTLDQRPRGDFPPLPADLLAAYGASPSDLSAVDTPYVLAVTAAHRPGRPPAHEWSARTVAGALGAATSSPVIDVFTPQLLPRDRLFASLPAPDGTFRLTDWMLLPHTSGRAGVYITTKGLARFGLPELQSENVPPALVEPWGRLLNGLARRVLDLWLDELPAGEQPLIVEIPETVPVGLRDIAAAQGTHEPMRREVSVRLRLDAGPILTVPDAPDRLCTALFGPCR